MSIPNIAIEELTVEERMELIERLWDSLEPEVAIPMSEALAAELDRRVAAINANPGVGRSWEDVKAELLQKHR